MPQRTIWLATAAVASIAAIAVGVLLATRSQPKPPPPARATGAAASAPAALVTAADKVHFTPNVEPGIGTVEGQPASAGRPPANPNLLPVGSIAPDFTLATPQGNKVSLRRLRGKVVLLELFATWCPHCGAETPHLQDIYTSLPKTRYAFVSVNGDGETAPSVFAYHRYFGLTFPALLDPSAHAGSFQHPGAAGRVSGVYRLKSFPTFYVIDAKGRIAWRGDGEQPDALLRRELHRAARA